ncbi:hypothetical protein OE88DRAFT_1715451 [Heliocybe sulcata]|uniref:DUF4218 domain-containing protein n=1 Tax=Heliocybe sulcata TaxID=5364 RepID=A0A5C3MIG6_9AGAM|nr:hypothetical protein OE88DRAFT_1715451 [Heliocybe sulcata]
MVKLWTGRYKDLDVGTEDYEISPHIWSVIAESWAFWFMYIAPIVLQGRFKAPKYYKHACALGEIMRISSQFEISDQDVEVLREKIIKWVEKYEKYYYQYKEERLPACPLTIHGLLHLPDDIKYCGPSWTSWTFYVERFCGHLKTVLRSRVQPWSNLNEHVRRLSMLGLLSVKYDLDEELASTRVNKRFSRGERVYPEYPHSILRIPCQRSYPPDRYLRGRIADHFLRVLSRHGATRDAIRKNLPEAMSLWGKVRIANGGDYIRTVWAMDHSMSPGRDCSFVRYELMAEQHRGIFQRKVYYGQLLHILVCELPASEFWGAQLGGKRYILAHIKPAITGNKDATEEVVSYQNFRESAVIDLQAIMAVVGRVLTRDKWGIIDRKPVVDIDGDA